MCLPSLWASTVTQLLRTVLVLLQKQLLWAGPLELPLCEQEEPWPSLYPVRSLAPEASGLQQGLTCTGRTWKNEVPEFP